MRLKDITNMNREMIYFLRQFGANVQRRALKKRRKKKPEKNGVEIVGSIRSF